MRAPVFALLFLVAFAPGASAMAPIYYAGFDDGSLPPDWTTSSGSLWNVGTCFANSPIFALQFNLPSTCNYDNDDRVSGSVTSAPYLLPSTSSPLAVQFASRANTEYPLSSDCGEHDAIWAEITHDGAPWARLYDECALTVAWNLRNFDVTPFAGQTIQVRWLFESGDSIANNYGGWAIDDFQIGLSDTTPPLPELPSLALALAGIAGIVALAARRRKD